MLTVQDLHDAFMELGARARQEGKVIDLADILNLLDVVGLHTLEDVVDFAASFYPEARISGRLHLGIQALWRVRDTPTQEGRHAAPTYLGRGRPAP